MTLIDTGETTMTGGRLKRVADHLDGTFWLTYGDGVADFWGSDIPRGALVALHKAQGTEATVTAIQPPARYGALDIRSGRVERFLEKPAGDGQWINGGFFVCETSVLDRGDRRRRHALGGRRPWKGLHADGQLSVYMHPGFWAAMDTLRDKPSSWGRSLGEGPRSLVRSGG